MINNDPLLEPVEDEIDPLLEEITPEAEEKYNFSKLQSGGMGLAQAATFQHADEIYSAISGDPIEKVRENFDEASKQNPVSYYGGMAAGEVGKAMLGVPLPLDAAASAAGMSEGTPVQKTIDAAGGAMISPMIQKEADIAMKAGKQITGQAIENVGLKPYVDNARLAFQKGLQDIQLKGGEFITDTISKARLIPERMEYALDVYRGEAGKGIGKRLAEMDAKTGKIDLAEKAQSYLDRLKSLKPATATQKRSIDLAIETIEGSSLGLPIEQSMTKVPYAAEKTVNKANKVFIPGGKSMAPAEVDLITGMPTVFKSNKVEVPSSSYKAPGQEIAGDYDVISGLSTPKAQTASTKINIPGYTSESVTDVPLMVPQQSGGRNITVMEPEVQNILGYTMVPGQTRDIFTIDQLTGTKTSNVVKSPSEIYKMKKTADTMLGYNKNSDPNFRTDNMPEAKYILDEWRHDLASMFRADPELDDLMTRVGAASEAMDDLPNLRTFLNSDKIFQAPDRDINFQNFLSKLKAANPEDYDQTIQQISPILENYRLAAIADPNAVVSMGPKWGLGTAVRSANEVGRVAGRYPRSMETIKQMGPVIINQLAKIAPEKAQEFQQALFAGDSAVLATIAGQFAPMYSDVLEPAPQGSKGQYSSYFDGKLHSAIDRDQYLLDLSNNKEMGSIEKAKKINEFNKTGRIQ